jgi:hypothetical protein
MAIKPFFPKRAPAMGPFPLIATLLVMLCAAHLSATPLSDAEIAEMLDAHNAVRRRVAQAESERLGGTVSIPDLTWDSALAAIAQHWADSLINKNPPTGGHRKKEELQQLGRENWHLEWSEGKANQSANVAVESWAEEKKWYDYYKNTCAPPMMAALMSSGCAITPRPGT